MKSFFVILFLSIVLSAALAQTPAPPPTPAPGTWELKTEKNFSLNFAAPAFEIPAGSAKINYPFVVVFSAKVKETVGGPSGTLVFPESVSVRLSQVGDPANPHDRDRVVVEAMETSVAGANVPTVTILVTSIEGRTALRFKQTPAHPETYEAWPIETDDFGQESRSVVPVPAERLDAAKVGRLILLSDVLLALAEEWAEEEIDEENLRHILPGLASHLGRTVSTEAREYAAVAAVK